MPFLRHTLDPSRAFARRATPADADAIMRLFDTSHNQQLSITSDELRLLLATEIVVVLDTGQALWGAAVASRPETGTTWLRGIALADNLSIDRGLERLIPALYIQARAASASCMYYAGDISSDVWLAPRLASYGFTHDTYVIVYAKRSMDQPAQGNTVVQVRRATADDLAAVMSIDHRCFEPQWAKNAGTIGAALPAAAFFVVAELEGQIIGYAYATSHYRGRQVHLVRIAVQPEQRHLNIGIRLMSELVAYARGSGADVLTLNTQEYNTSARRLYEWFGFRRTGERQLILRSDL
jgi:ribosomal protein S18 acetylase RimI-like enzyme